MVCYPAGSDAAPSPFTAMQQCWAVSVRSNFHRNEWHFCSWCDSPIALSIDKRLIIKTWPSDLLNQSLHFMNTNYRMLSLICERCQCSEMNATITLSTDILILESHYVAYKESLKCIQSVQNSYVLLKTWGLFGAIPCWFECNYFSKSLGRRQYSLKKTRCA